MEKYELYLAAPMKLQGLKKEIESIHNYCGRQTFLQVTGQSSDIKELQAWMADGSTVDPDFILIFDITGQRVNQERADEELLDCLQRICFSRSSKIIMVLPESKKTDLPFINELIKLDIQNFYFTETFGSDDIATWLFQERTLKDNEQYLATNLTKSLKPEKEVIIKEVVKEVVKEVFVPAPVEEYIAQVKEVTVSGTISIGVFSVSRGAGATRLTLEIADAVAKCGYQVACIGLSGNDEGWKSKNKHIDCVEATPENKEAILQRVYCGNQYPVVIIDFGELFQIDSAGSLVSMKQELSGDFFRCSFKIGCAFTDPWHYKKLEFFLNDEVFVADHMQDTLWFMVSGLEMELVVKDYHEMNLMPRGDIESMLGRLFQSTGLSKKTSTKRQRFRGLF